MAGQRNVLKASALLVAVVAMFSTVSAQDLGGEITPAPSPDQGAAYSLPVSGAILCSSLVLSLLALVKH